MIKMWPRDTDILMNWDEESLEMLQDPTLIYEAEKQYNDFIAEQRGIVEMTFQETVDRERANAEKVFLEQVKVKVKIGWK